jgi:uncharacterized phage-like protein YoqJ
VDKVEKLSCAITGHPPQRFKFKHNEQAPLCKNIKATIENQIKILYSEGVRIFYVDCAVGVGTWAAETVLDLKQQAEYSEIELFCAIPFPNHTERFTDKQKERYKRILEGSTYQEVISRKYFPTAYKRQSYFMVDKSQYLIALYDQDRTERSSLGQMVNYAIKNNLQIIFINPDTADVSKCEETQ